MVVTLALDPVSFAFFDDLRQRHFPPGRNQVPAHLSLFHSLPGEERPSIESTVASVCASRDSFSMKVSGLRNLGRGVAFSIESKELQHLHAELRRAFSAWLTPQDQQRFHPHITVQNKASGSEAKELLASLETQGWPATITGVGVDLWRYLGGPWEPLASLPLVTA